MNLTTADELAKLMASDAVYAIFDVRERGEYNAKQISYATSLPRSQIEFRVAELVSDRKIPVIVYDDGSGRAELAQRTLSQLGYTDVRVLEGGITTWEREGRGVASGVNVPSKAFGEKVQHEQAVPDISPQDLKSMLDAHSEVIIFDVRTPEEYGRFCIPGGVNVPGGDLVLWAASLKEKPSKPVIVNCAGRTRSIIGTAALRRLGLDHVLELRNGTMGWVLAGYDLEVRPNRKGPVAPEESRAHAFDLSMKLAEEEKIAWSSAEVVSEVARGTAAGVTYLIDVRSEGEYENGHIASSISLPGGQAVQRTDDFIAVRNARIIFVSGRSARAVMAAYWYKRMGFRKIAVLRGGIQAWVESGRELTLGPERKEPLGYEAAVNSVRWLKASEAPRVAQDASTTIVDVGSSVDYEAAHVPRAHWISRGWLELKLPRRLPEKNSSILLTCPDGKQSVFAAKTLSEMGYLDVAALQGGLHEWRTAGYEIENGMTSLWSEPNDVVVSPSITGNKDEMRRYLDWEVQLTGPIEKPAMTGHAR